MTFDILKRSRETRDMLVNFDYNHLPEHLRGFSIQCHDLAMNMVHDLPDSVELSVGLRKLLEAKDCFVRAANAGTLEQFREEEEAFVGTIRREVFPPEEDTEKIKHYYRLVDEGVSDHEARETVWPATPADRVTDERTPEEAALSPGGVRTEADMEADQAARIAGVPVDKLDR